MQNKLRVGLCPTLRPYMKRANQSAFSPNGPASRRGLDFLVFHSKLIAISMILVMLFSVTGCKNETAENTQYECVKLVMAVNGTDIAADTKIAMRFARLVQEESNGTVQIHVFANDQLAGGNSTRGVKMLASGAVDIAGYASGTMSVLDDRLSVGMIPWTFSNYKEARRVIDETGGEYYAKLLAKHGLTYLGSAHNGIRQITNNKHAIHTPDDMHGLRIRIPAGEVHERIMTILGAEPIIMSWSEVPAAIQNKVIDGQENGFSVTNSARLNQIQPYMTVWNYIYENYIFAVNTKTFSNLEPKTRIMLMEKMKTACEWGRDMVESEQESIRKLFLAEGTEITELSEEELEPFKERANPLIDELKKKYGQEACDAFRIP